MTIHAQENSLFTVTWSVIGQISPRATTYHTSVEDAQAFVSRVKASHSDLLAKDHCVDRANFFVPYDQHIRSVLFGAGREACELNTFVRNEADPDGVVVATIDTAICDARLPAKPGFVAKPRNMTACWMLVLEQEQSGFVFDYGIMLVGRDYLVSEGEDVRVEVCDAFKLEAKRTRIRTKDGSARMVGYLASGDRYSQVKEAADLGNGKAVIRRCFTENGFGCQTPMAELTDGLISLPVAVAEIAAVREILVD